MVFVLTPVRQRIEGEIRDDNEFQSESYLSYLDWSTDCASTAIRITLIPTGDFKILPRLMIG